jgi:hypothetical protein
MPELTRKRVNDQPERWHVHYADVRVGPLRKPAQPIEYGVPKASE